MSKNKLLTLILLIPLLALFLHQRVKAADYSIQSNLIYEIEDSGNTHATQQITFKNHSNRILIPQYSLSFNMGRVTEIKAFDAKGQIGIQIQEFPSSDRETAILNLDSRPVKANQSISWTIEYKTDGIAKKEGGLWEVVVPQKEEHEDESYTVLLKVPKGFGTENYVAPAPRERIESGQFYEYRFDGSEIGDETINASFGGAQAYSIDLTYHLENPTDQKAFTEIALPADKTNQRVYLEKLTPTPVNVITDDDGNYLARYDLEAKEKLEVNLLGKIVIFPQNRDFSLAGGFDEMPTDFGAYLADQKYWEVNDEEIVSVSKEITKSSQTVVGASRLIFDYVTHTLKYNEGKIYQDSQRLGAKGALQNPTNAVCIEFTDLFIALARSAGIPSREINGYAWAPSEEFKPDLYDVLHAWVEIYVPRLGWIQIDPTWSAPPSTIELFSKFDTKHIAFVTKGLDSEIPYPAGSYKTEESQESDVKIQFVDLPQISNPEPGINLAFSGKLAAGSWNDGLITVANPGPMAISDLTINPYSDDLEIRFNSIRTDTLPPFGSIELPIEIKSSNLWIGHDAEINLVLNYSANDSGHELVKSESFNFKPIWNRYLLPLGLLIFGIGGVFLVIHLIEYAEKRRSKKSRKNSR